VNPFYLDGMFALFHPGGTGTPVLLCPPFGWEDMTSYRGRRDWAEHLAAAGHPVLRIDLPGTGDSAGGPRDPELLRAWTDAVDAATRWLRAETGAGRVAVIGIGLGGLVAAHAIAHGARVEDLVLWGVPARGRTLTREIRAFARLEASRLTAQGARDAARLPEGGLAAAGYLVTAETRAAIDAVDLTAPGDDRPERVLLLDRDGVADRDLAAAYAGADLSVASGRGYAEMVLGDMQAVRPPAQVFAKVADWLADAPSRAEAPPARRPRQTSLELDTASGRIRESALVVERPEGRLFGVLAEPVDGDAGLTLVLLNAGPQRRTGPNRMWVELARRWAGRGVPALRLDMAGIGDADGVPYGWDQEWGFYDDDRAGQLRAALDALAARGLPSRFVLLGLCSGANWAFHGALRDERVAAAILLNPRALFYTRWGASAGSDVGRIASAALWRRLLAGEISRRGMTRFLRGLRRALTEWPLRRWHRRAERRSAARHGDPLDQALDRLAEAGRALVVVFTDREPLRAELERTGRLSALAARPLVSVQLIPTAAETHTLQPLWVQERVHPIVDLAIERELDRTSPQPVADP
jgi:pimeloyl-ACP methyl ester carboxylesterase